GGKVRGSGKGGGEGAKESQWNRAPAGHQQGRGRGWLRFVRLGFVRLGFVRFGAALRANAPPASACGPPVPWGAGSRLPAPAGRGGQSTGLNRAARLAGASSPPPMVSCLWQGLEPRNCLANQSELGNSFP